MEPIGRDLGVRLADTFAARRAAGSDAAGTAAGAFEAHLDRRAAASPSPADTLSLERAAARADAAVDKLMPMLVASMLDAMLPRSETVVGGGLAGDTWRTMLANELSTVIAARMSEDRSDAAVLAGRPPGGGAR